MVQITPLPLPASSFNFSSKEKGFTFFGLKSFWSQEAMEPFGSVWFLQKENLVISHVFTSSPALSVVVACV